MNDHNRKAALAAIRSNIERYGHHIYLIPGETYPRFAYTIGLRDQLGQELLFAGGYDFVGEEVVETINVIAERMQKGAGSASGEMTLGDLGSFRFRDAHATWTSEMMLGALDYFGATEIPAAQIVPDDAHWTIDLPDTSVPWTAQSAPIWRHLYEPWPYDFSPDLAALTNLAALRGQPVIDAARKSDDLWELFAGSDMVKLEDRREVPLSTLLLSDPGLMEVTRLSVGERARRLPGMPFLT